MAQTSLGADRASERFVADTHRITDALTLVAWCAAQDGVYTFAAGRAERRTELRVGQVLSDVGSIESRRGSGANRLGAWALWVHEMGIALASLDEAEQIRLVGAALYGDTASGVPDIEHRTGGALNVCVDGSGTSIEVSGERIEIARQDVMTRAGQ